MLTTTGDIDQSIFDIPEDYSVVREAYTGAEMREMFKAVRSKGESTAASENLVGEILETSEDHHHHRRFHMKLRRHRRRTSTL